MSFDVCMALEVDDDTFGFGHTCIDFQRSLAVPSSSCDLGKPDYCDNNNDILLCLIVGKRCQHIEGSCRARLTTG